MLKHNHWSSSLEVLAAVTGGGYRGYALGRVPRDLMPQIDKHDASDFRKYFGLELVASAEGSTFRPTQRELDPTKVAMFRQPEVWAKVGQLPVYVSQDGWILDGHYRWAAANGDATKQLLVCVFPTSAPIALSVMFLFARYQADQPLDEDDIG